MKAIKKNMYLFECRTPGWRTEFAWLTPFEAATYVDGGLWQLDSELTKVVSDALGNPCQATIAALFRKLVQYQHETKHAHHVMLCALANAFNGDGPFPITLNELVD